MLATSVTVMIRPATEASMRLRLLTILLTTMMRIERIESSFIRYAPAITVMPSSRPETISAS